MFSDILYRYRIILVAMVSLLVVGCSKDNETSATVQCTFKADIDISINTGASTKAVAGDGSCVNLCVMEIFHNGKVCDRKVSPVIDGKVEMKATVVSERTYDIFFWAYCDGRYDAASLRAIRLANGVTRLDSEEMDAFCARCIGVTINQEQTVIPVTLKRALAMVSVNVSPQTAPKPTIGINAPTCFDLMTNSISDIRPFTWDTTEKFYLFAPETPTDMEVKINGLSCQNIPVRRNYKTNIFITIN